jgi:quercetin dioxygenase-like cupin family protein
MRMTPKRAASMLITCISLLVMACNSNKTPVENTVQTTSPLFPKGEKLPSEWFTGNAYLKPLLAKDKNNEFALGSVTFEPGARSVWHTHPKGQVLIVTDGEGFYQEKGKPAQALKKGVIVNVPENTEHWHGASASKTLVHIALTNYKGNENVVWLKPVTQDEYNRANGNNEKR